MESAVRWLKASYITGAVADGLIGILMLLPGRIGEAEFRYPMGLWCVVDVWLDGIASLGVQEAIGT